METLPVSNQMELFEDFIFDTKKQLDALNYIRSQAKISEKAEIATTFQIYDELLRFLSRMLWEIIVLNLYSIFHNPTGVNIYWYLGKLKEVTPELSQRIDIKEDEVDNLNLDKVKKLRDKWIAHKDKEAFENPQIFWEPGKGLHIPEMDELLGKAIEIVQLNGTISDLTGHGVEKLFALIGLLVTEHPDAINTLEEYKIIPTPEVW